LFEHLNKEESGHNRFNYIIFERLKVYLVEPEKQSKKFEKPEGSGGGRKFFKSSS